MLAILLLTNSCKYSNKPLREYYNGHRYLVFQSYGGNTVPIHDPDCPNHPKNTIRIYRVIE